MQYLFIDESGTMTKKFSKKYPKFVITVVNVTAPKELKKAFKRYISKNIKRLKLLDKDNKMFINDKFKEIKGSNLPIEIKSDFIKYLCKQNRFKVYYIEISNEKVMSYLYDNTARAFNYVLCKALICWLQHGVLPKDEYSIVIDERNESTGTKHTLQEYLNMRLRFEDNLTDNITVTYTDSSINSLVQIADLFSNSYYNNIFNKCLKETFGQMRDDGYLHAIYHFPQNKIFVNKNIDKLVGV